MTMRIDSARSLLAALLFAGICGDMAVAAGLSAAPDRFVVADGETFDFILSLTDGDSRAPPDVSALGRDFEIVDRRRTSRAEMVSGKPVHVDQWVMTLRPKRTGTLTLPVLTIGGLSSQPAQVQVVPAAAPADLGDEPLLVRVEAAATSAFAQSEIPVTLRIYDRIGMRGGSIEKPMADGATFVPDGGQRSYMKTIGQRRYRVIEQSYLMRPQKSGTIEIPPISLKASLPGFRGSSAGSDMARVLGRGAIGDPAERTMTVSSRPVTVTVRPRPREVTGWFLPARGVLLDQSWSAPPTGLKVGETLTRTITLAARGASPNQLPPLEPAPVDGLRQYGEETHSDATLIDGEAGSVLTARFSLVPTRPGEFILPAIEIPWWNLATQRQEIAVLPAVTLNVRPGMEPVPSATAIEPAPGSEAASGPPPASPAVDAGRGSVSTAIEMLKENRVAAGLVAACAAVLFFLAVRRARKRIAMSRRLPPEEGMGRRRGPLRATSREEEARLWSALVTACRQNDARAAHGVYSTLARQNAFSATPSTELAAAADALARHLYGNEAGGWNGTRMLKALRRHGKRQARRDTAQSGPRLAPLYPGAR